LRKIGGIPGKKGRVIRNHDGGDFQVHGADPNTQATKPLIFNCGSLIEIEHQDVSKAQQMCL